ncbi:MAG: 3-oxoacyl-ACP reductase FabG [Clostridia bacterium]
MIKKTVLITGAAKGIGAEIAKNFAKDEYNVCINYNTSMQEAYSLKDEILNLGYICNIYKCDISKRDEVDIMVNNVIADYGSIDVLVNNAGICEYKLFIDITNEDLTNMINTTIVGTFNVTQAVLKKSMIKNQNGVIVNMSSIWGIVGASFETNYSTSKAAIIGMSKALAKELALSNIRVNVVAPGMIDTQMNEKLSKEEIDEFLSDIPMGRIGTSQEVASLVKFLASDEAGYITGQVISPNGGVVI